MSLHPDIPCVVLHSPEGARAVVALHGAHVLSWQPPGEGEALFLSRQSAFGAGAAIRGGVPLIFPQFGTRGAGKRHGFARNAGWHCVGAEAGSARFALTHDDVPGAGWPHAFRLQYDVSLAGDALVLALTVVNADTVAWPFHAALHTYLRVDDIRDAAIEGLQGLDYLDQVKDGAMARETAARLAFAGEVDRIYADLRGPLVLRDGVRALRIEQEGFADAVIWNPGVDKARALQDLEAGGEFHFACVEAGAILREISLAPGQSWQGKQILRPWRD